MKFKHYLYRHIRLDKNEEFYKIGITGRGIKERYPYYSNLPYSWEIVEEIVSLDLEFIWN